MKKKLLICGNYGAGNFGDEAILGGIINLLKSSFLHNEISVMSADPGRTAREFGYPAVSFFPAGWRSGIAFWLGGRWVSVFRAVMGADLVILGGGGLFSDERPRAVWIWFVQGLWFWLFRKKYVCLAQSVGPLHSKWAQRLTAFVWRHAVLRTVRDSQSQQLLEKIGVRDVSCLADPAFALVQDEKSAYKSEDTVVISLRNWSETKDNHNIDILAEFVEYVRQKYGFKFIFVPFADTSQETDVDCFQKLSDKCQIELEKPDDYIHALEIISRSRFVIGMRLHSIIFAVLAQKPFLALSYSKKVRDFTEVVGMKEFCLDYLSLNLESLKKLFDSLVSEEKSLKTKLAKEKMNQTYAVYRHEKLLNKASFQVGT